MKRCCIGVLAHVDAGKTTLSESILYQSGTLRRAGRVDNGDAFLDTYALEKERGITIFSKQAVFPLFAVQRRREEDAAGAACASHSEKEARTASFSIEEQEISVTLLDTPGHVDFSAEMERTLQVLDAAVLVINGADGVQGHTLTLWRLLAQYRVPTLLFVNKMDQQGTDREALLAQLKRDLHENCVDFAADEADFAGSGAAGASCDGADFSEDSAVPRPHPVTEAFYDSVAMCDEEAMELFLESGVVPEEKLRALTAERKLFPCYFGSALKMTGVSELLAGIAAYAPTADETFAGRKLHETEGPGAYCERARQDKQQTDSGMGAGQVFGGRVYKISRDEQGNRLTHIKVTQGLLNVKDVIRHAGMTDGGSLADGRDSAGCEEEKVNQIRIYHGTKFQTVSQAEPGMICALTGLEKSYAGEGLGAEQGSNLPVLEPVLTCELLLPEDQDPAKLYPRFKTLEEEIPELHLVWEEKSRTIQGKLMGQVQTEILERLIAERFGVKVTFGPGRIVYKETIAQSVEGVGHYEPLRHYAEVHLVMTPSERGSGLTFESDCSEDVLDRNWQRLILTHLKEREHKGVLTGSAITDMKISLVSGRAHLKHTEGGDFRQAVYRAVRHGLMKAENVLLEPYYAFRLEIPAANVGRALSDMDRLCAKAQPPMVESDHAVITGIAPVACMQEYSQEVISYTKGIGRLAVTLHGYEPCHDPEETLNRIAYDPQADAENPSGSVFCAHGAGFYVPWEEVERYMHLPLTLTGDSDGQEDDDETSCRSFRYEPRQAEELSIGTDEIDEILNRTAYANRKPHAVAHKGISAGRAAGKRTGGRAAGGRTGSATDRYGSGDGRQNIPAETRNYTAAEKGNDLGNYVSAGEERYAPADRRKEYLLVDGYNVIFAWDDLKELAETTLDGARGKLLDLLCDYQAARGCELIAVFDAYRLQGHPEETLDYHNIHVVYTREAETADRFIERFAHENGKKYDVTVATSDGLEQIIIRGAGCRLISSRELKEEMERTRKSVMEGYRQSGAEGKRYLLDGFHPEDAPPDDV